VRRDILFRLYKDESGNGLLLFSLFFMIFMGIAGLVIDAGMLYKTKAELRKTANAAVLSGAQELTNSDNAVTLVVQEILKAHNEEASLKELLIKPDGKNKLTITLEKDVSLSFMKLFKINTTKINASASAAIAPMTSGPNAVPLGIDKNTQLEYMKEYKLKVDAGDSTFGNFGILALSGVGANLYEQDLINGYASELEIGDIIPTQTGNVEGKTRTGVNYRISSSPYAVDDYSHRDDPRVILILIYEPYLISNNQLKSVKICGFAYFYLKQPMSYGDSEITGYFIQRVGVGTGDVSAEDNGAYAIRLVE
jgi:Flp pilus assembly protein TadG